MRGNQVAIAVGAGLVVFGLATPVIGIYWTALAIGVACLLAGWLNRPTK
jgi:hypothetical protein